MQANENDTINESMKNESSYHLIKERLNKEGKNLKFISEELNNLRQEEFGKIKSEIIAKTNILTNSNVVPIDMIEVNGHILLAHEGNSQLKQNYSAIDFFSLYKIEKNKENEYVVLNIDFEKSFLNNSVFINSIINLKKYYKKSKIVKLKKIDNKFYAFFKTGEGMYDFKIYKWLIENNQTVTYVGDNGDVDFDNIGKGRCDINWISTVREDHVSGKHPHVNIMDKIFVETINGDLTIKNENNTENEDCIYSEEVENKTQVLEDAKIFYSKLDKLILLKILPFQEKEFRYFIYNEVNEKVTKIKSKLDNNCIFLPENHGFLFSDGYYLKDGTYKIFDTESNKNLTFGAMNESPNGEDFMYVFTNYEDGSYVIYSYNIIRKELENPIHANGYSLFENGELFIFRTSENHEYSKIHSLRVYKTPFEKKDFFESKNKEVKNKFIHNIGNKEIVTAISELYSICTLIKSDEVTVTLYETLIKQVANVANRYSWLDSEEALNIKKQLNNIVKVSENIISEFTKAKSLQELALSKTHALDLELNEIINKSESLGAYNLNEHVDFVNDSRKIIGELVSSKEIRYINLETINLMIENANNAKNKILTSMIECLLKDNSFDGYLKRLSNIEGKISQSNKAKDLSLLVEQTQSIIDEINMINSEIFGISNVDSDKISFITDRISTIFSKTNQLLSKIKREKTTAFSEETKIEFSSQLKLLNQSLETSINKAISIENCDNELAKVVAQLETLESKYNEHEEFLIEILKKQNEINDIFENIKNSLISQNQEKIEKLMSAAKITLNSINKKALRYKSLNELNSFFNSDSMILKINDFVDKIKNLNDPVKADSLVSQVKTIKDFAIRSLRDNNSIFEDDGKIIKLGNSRFSVNKNNLDLSIIAKQNESFLHLSGTNYYAPINLGEYVDVISMNSPMESENVYRSEILALSFFNDVQSQKYFDLSFDSLMNNLKTNEIELHIKKYISKKHNEGYINGVHDHDASLILEKFILIKNDKNLSFTSNERSLATYLSLLINDEKNKEFKDIYEQQLKEKLVKFNCFGNKEHLNEISEIINNYILSHVINVSTRKKDLFLNMVKNTNLSNTFIYLDNYLNSNNKNYYISKESKLLSIKFDEFIKNKNFKLKNDFFDIFEAVNDFYETKDDINKKFLFETSIILFLSMDKKSNNKIIETESGVTFAIKDMIGEHKLINNRVYNFDYYDLCERVYYHLNNMVNKYYKFIDFKNKTIEDERKKLSIKDFANKPISSFIRNKLITESYFPIFGNNLSKQIGTADKNKRTDNMGLLLLISPPGYGKTTLVEYIANKMGMILVKINCPSLSRDVVSLGESSTTDLTSKAELRKLNLAFEMGENVMLYLDDIQHTNPEFLQKFISLCDGTRKVDGEWNGKSKTYDMKGKRFAIIMSGNPYTENGKAFKIPDMLANRADVYNLGEHVSGQMDAFEMSYIENSLTSNTVLAPLANRNLDDLYKFIDLAKGKNMFNNEFEHPYINSEIEEIVSILKHIIRVQKTVSKINENYIMSSSIEDKYRNEPAFKLQGSYRNMNKIIEKILPVMNDSEIDNIVIDHYRNESQALTEGTEENFLKFKSIFGIMDENDRNRWNEILNDFTKYKNIGGDDVDGVTKIANILSSLLTLMTSFFNKEKTNK